VIVAALPAVILPPATAVVSAFHRSRLVLWRRLGLRQSSKIAAASIALLPEPAAGRGAVSSLIDLLSSFYIAY
jgi:hypothetical protein